MTVWINPAMGLPNYGGGDHAPTSAMGDSDGGNAGPAGGVPGEAPSDRMGRRLSPLAPLLRVLAAWGAILLGGSSLMLTGQLDWWGLYGERAVFATALGAAAFVVWYLGERSEAERRACWASIACALLALALFPAGTRLQFNAAVGLVHLGLCWQLLAWAAVARKAQKRGLWIIAAAVAVEALVIMPLAQLTAPDVACATGSRLACLYDAWVALALPALVTLLLALCWLNPILNALNGRRFGGR